MNREDEELFVKEVLEFFDQEHEPFSVDTLLPEPEPLQKKTPQISKQSSRRDSILSTLIENPTKKTKIKSEFQNSTTKTFSGEENIDSSPGQPTLYIKPARKTPKYYIPYFPEKIYCSPYKYDLLVQIPTDLNEKSEVVFVYLDSETNEEISFNHKNKPALDIGKTRVTQKDEKITELLYRVCFTVCSFHHYRRPFILKAFLKDKETEEEKLFFRSKPFQTFARKNDLEDIEAWVSDEEEEPKRKKRKLFKIEEEAGIGEEIEEEKKHKRRKFKKEIILPDEMDSLF
eukprot:gene6788-10952_t